MSPCAASLREMTDVAIPYRFYPGQARWGAASVFQIDACEAGADPAEDFIADGVLPGGQVVRGDRDGALPAQQDRLVAWTDAREVRHVNHRGVHADPPDDRNRPAADQHVPPVGQGAAVPVGVADRQDGQGRGAGCDERAAVADRLARADAFDLHDSGLPRERGTELGCGRRPVDIPVQHKAGTHAVEVAGREAEDGGAVGDVRGRHPQAGCLGCVEQLAKADELVFGRLAVACVGRGEMAHEAFQAQGRRPVGAEEVQEFVPRESQAAHAGVHFEVDGQGRGAGIHEAGGHEDGVPRGENRYQVQFLKKRHVLRKDAAHHQDRGGDAGLPEFLAFRHRGDAQLVRPRRRGRARDGDGPVAVRVGLDDGDDGDRSDAARDLTEVMAEGGQGNLDDGGIQISVISVSFFLTISSTLVMYESVSFWSSSWAFLASSSGIWEAFWPFLISSSTSRRMLRMWTRTSSAIFFACFTSSLRRSSVSGGIGRRMSLPSLVGVRPRSEARIAFSMSLIILASNGWTVRSRFSGAASVATCLRGVGVP